MTVSVAAVVEGWAGAAGVAVAGVAGVAGTAAAGTAGAAGGVAATAGARVAEATALVGAAVAAEAERITVVSRSSSESPESVLISETGVFLFEDSSINALFIILVVVAVLDHLIDKKEGQDLDALGEVLLFFV